MASVRLWQAIIFLVAVVVVTINIRLLMSVSMASDNRHSRGLLDDLGGLAAIDVEPCKRPVIMNINKQAGVIPLNSSVAQLKWLEIKNGHAKIIGFQRDSPGFLTIGIPNIKRINGMTYLVETITSIIDRTSTIDKTSIVVVVFLADFDTDYNSEVVEILSDKFMEYINIGLIQIVQASTDFYPPLDHLKRNFNDKEDRVSWRSKQVADFAFMFLYSHNLSEYYIQIEDDVMCAKDFVRSIREYIASLESRRWSVLDFSELGFIGKLFHSSDLTKLARYMLTFYDEQPVDWLLRYFRFSMAQQQVFLRKPTLFQHIGLKSSFDLSHDNKLKDKYFDSGEKPWRSDDPPAKVLSNMQPFDDHIPGLAYASGGGYFWGANVVSGDWFAVVFDEYVEVSRIAIETGDPQTHKDNIQDGVLEISSKLITLEEHTPKVTCASFINVASFEGGRVDINRESVPLLKKPVKCLRVTIGEEQKTWVILYQVAIFKVS